MDLKSQSNNDIIIHIKQLVQKEKSLTVQIIDSLLEVEKRKAFLPKQTNMYAFLTEELGYCAGTSMLRLNAMRALKVVPEVREKILDNKLSLNDVAKTQSYINKINRSASVPLSKMEQKELFIVAENVSPKDLELALVNKHNEIDRQRADAKGNPAPEPRKFYKKIVVEAEPVVIELIEELKSLLSHKIIDGDLNQMLKEVLPLAIREIKIKKGLAKRSTTINPSFPTSSMRLEKAKPLEGAKKVTRSIPNEIKRLVWKRDHGQCQFRESGTNKICGSTFQVEFDHVRPWSFNGEHTVENIMICCKSHNLFRWKNIDRMNFEEIKKPMANG